jgi:hypothetical protein
VRLGFSSRAPAKLNSELREQNTGGSGPSGGAGRATSCFRLAEGAPPERRSTNARSSSEQGRGRFRRWRVSSQDIPAVGDLRWFSAGQMVPLETAFALARADRDLVRTQCGFHIIVEDTREGGTRRSSRRETVA